MKKLVAMICIAVAGMVSTGAMAQTAALKAAYVSVDEVVQMMPEYRKAMGDLAQFDSALQINYAETLQELNRQDSIMKADSTKWSNAQKAAKKESLRKLFTDLQGFEQSYQQQMQQKQEELLAPVAQKANQLIQDVAKTAGYTHVFRKEALLVYPDGDDLLPKVKAKLGPNAVTPPARPGIPKK
jgi:outer membrane protein